jgi:hypothetical protein
MSAIETWESLITFTIYIFGETVNNAIKVVVVIIVAVLLIFSYFVIYHNNPAPPIKKNVPLLLEVEFIESGLPSGKKWTVSMAGSSESSSNNTIIFRENNGTYSYTVLSGDPDFSPSVASGSVSLNGKAVLQSVSFIMLYNASFYEEGMPSGTRWFVNISDPQSFNSTSNSIVIQLPNGTYSYTVSVADQSFKPLSSQSSGSFSISGGPVSPAPQTSPIVMEKQYLVTFNETGLKSQIVWNINLSATQTFSSYNSSNSFYESNGTFNFTAYAPGYDAYPSSGNFTVNGSAVNITVKFIKLYSVTFTENGLPSGKYWSVELGSAILGSTSSSIIFIRPNGSYTYIIVPVKGYSASPSYGNINIKGAKVKVAIAFTVNNSTNYTVVFTETGLPAGSSWTVDLNGTKQSSSAVNIMFTEPNGTYQFSVTDVPTYSPSPESGYVTVNGSDQNLTIDFTTTGLYVTFTVKGLPPGTDWPLEFNGTNQSVSSNSITFQVQNRTIYTYYVISFFSSDKSELFYPLGMPFIPVYWWVNQTTGIQFPSNQGGFYVDGTDVNIELGYTIMYSVTFVVTGLPSGGYASLLNETSVRTWPYPGYAWLFNDSSFLGAWNYGDVLTSGLYFFPNNYSYSYEAFAWWANGTQDPYLSPTNFTNFTVSGSPIVVSINFVSKSGSTAIQWYNILNLQEYRLIAPSADRSIVLAYTSIFQIPAILSIYGRKY